MPPNLDWGLAEEQADIIHHRYYDGYKQLAAAIVLQAIEDVTIPRPAQSREALAWLCRENAYQFAFWGCGVDRSSYRKMHERLRCLVQERIFYARMRHVDTLDLCCALAISENE